MQEAVNRCLTKYYHYRPILNLRLHSKQEPNSSSRTILGLQLRHQNFELTTVLAK